MLFTNLKVANSPAELRGILNQALQEFDEAVRQNEVYPHSSHAHYGLQALENFQEALSWLNDGSRLREFAPRGQFNVNMGGNIH